MSLALEYSELEAGLQVALVRPITHAGKFIETSGRSLPKDTLDELAEELAGE